MFESKTLFVVGAGASSEIGLPVGSALLKSIAKNLRISFKDGYELRSGSPELVEAIRWYARSKNQDQNIYYQKGRMIEEAVPVAPSIDNFLDAHKKDAHLQFCGKLGIAASILEAERNSLLYSDDSRGSRSDLSRIDSTWYAAFMRMLVERVDLDEIENIFENVSFITFNYDRCIQFFLHVSLQKYYGITADRAAGLISGLNIIHPYGSVGRLPFEVNGGDVVEYGAELMDHSLVAAAKKIRTFTERIEDEEWLEKIREEVRCAQTIVFLGFAFHPQNMELLDIGMSHSAARVFATSFGCSASDRDVISAQVRAMVGQEDAEYSDVKISYGERCADLFSEFSRSISRRII